MVVLLCDGTAIIFCSVCCASARDMARIRTAGSVIRLSFWIKNAGWNQSFQCQTPTNSDTVAITGVDSGMMILNKIVKYPAPSICADSSSAAGSSLKNDINRMI